MFTRYCFDSVSNTYAASVNTHMSVRECECECECLWGYSNLAFGILTCGEFRFVAAAAAAIGIFMNGKR